MKHSTTGIIVFGHTRSRQLHSVLESLRRQDAGLDIHVWIDGHSERMLIRDAVQQCRKCVQDNFPQMHHTFLNGHIGIEKMTLDGLTWMAGHYDRIIVLEDDCFPTASAICVFQQELDTIADIPDVYSVYGHHFLTDSEGETITRFQGWGWATTAEKLQRILPRLRDCFCMHEPDYLRWVDQQLTHDIQKRLDVTPGRNCTDVLKKFFSWDSCTCLLTAQMGLAHKKTHKRVIYNCGMGDHGGHFPVDSRFRHPPFNMISPDEVWHYFDDTHTASSADPSALNKQGEKLFLRGDIEGARRAFVSALEHAPECADAHNNLGVVYEQSREPDKACCHLAEALRINPDNKYAVINYADVLQKRQQAAEAAAVYREYLKRHPGDDEIARLCEKIQTPSAAADTSQRPLLITGAHRSGTTLAGRILSASPEISYIDEPFNPNHGRCSCGFQLKRWFEYVNADSENMVLSHMHHLLGMHSSAAVKKRALIKDPIALLSAEWLAARFNMDVVILIRHPAGFAGSLKRLGWEFPFEHLLQQPLLIGDHLQPFADEIRHFSHHKQGIVDQAILLWNVLYSVVQRYQHRRPGWLYIRHEDICRNSEGTFKNLCSRLGIAFDDTMSRALHECCSRKNPDESPVERPHEVRINSASAVWSWQSRLTASEIEKIYHKTRNIASQFYSDEEWGVAVKQCVHVQ